MSFDSKLLATAALLCAPLLLAACGSPAEEADQPPTVADQVDVPDVPATPVAVDVGSEEAQDPAAAADDEPEATASASPSPSPTPSARPSAAATTAAAAVTAPPMWAVCSACHSVEAGDHGIGPSLAGVFNSRAASKPGFDYSEAMESSGLTWNEATLDSYLADPRAVVPGTSMAYAGLKNDAQRAAVIEYLKSL
jgi:cytochrome c2